MAKQQANEMSEYGIVANILEVDRAFRFGAKAWMAQWESGGERARWVALSRGGRIIEKYASVHRFKNFRCAWIPEHLRKRIFQRGTRKEMEEYALFWEKRAEEARSDHPNRLFQTKAG